MNIEHLVAHLEAELLTLRHELHQLRAKNEEQEKRISQLVQENTALRLENQRLRDKLTTVSVH